ncbi:LysR substrate-binding domain-containing protein [Paracoccus benzoatiresistens]|uniref:LysR substrate-binding domain-containing protein n=1 Tax=Paracoccus benzoatiresistens TaxID=2997341 RepID=A0ABT4JA81_9RHOB|nr:LysR substrate-binding domain-containing protein [Paracoccus sp. EF6]MCZ0963371.1 LysR substrate-binding domain-containing protein [Paracoccus sp. EF6]
MKLSRSQMPDLSALQAFEAAARHGSFTRAAVELNLTQSAISRQIKELEAQLGVALFERIRQRIVLSSAGEQLRPEIESLLAGLEHLTLRAASRRDVTGHLAVATLPTFGSRWLMPRLPNFLAEHPGIQISVLSRDGHFDLAEASVDVAIHYGKPAWPGATCAYLCAETVLPVAAPGLIGADGTFPDAAPLLHMQSRPMQWPEWLTANGQDVVRGFQGHRFDQFSLLIEATVAGLGMALLPSYLIEREIRQGLLRIIPGPPSVTDAAYYVVIPDERVSDPLPSAFRNWVTGQVGSG